MGYDYMDQLIGIKNIIKKHGDIDFFSIGESVMERKIYCIKTGHGEKKLFICAAHHGLEYITAAFLIRFIDEFLSNSSGDKTFFGYDTDRINDNVSIFFVPMVNPDGVDIAVNGIDLSKSEHRDIINITGIESFSSKWQANANGVDINHNYDAGWKSILDYPSPSRYCGPYAESEPETKAITEFIRSHIPDILISFHSQGREIYYDFENLAPMFSEELAKIMASVSGYTLSRPEGYASFGGLKDWFIKEFGRPGYTVEMGSGKNPLPTEMLDGVFEENARIILSAAEYLCFK